MQAATAAECMGSSNTSLEQTCQAEENAFYRTSLALSKPEISGFQFCIRYTLIDKTSLRSYHSNVGLSQCNNRNLAWFRLEYRLHRSRSA